MKFTLRHKVNRFNSYYHLSYSTNDYNDYHCATINKAFFRIFVHCFRKPWFHFDFIYKFSKDYRQLKKHCDFVHSISDDVIRKRKETLVRIHYYYYYY